MSDFVRLLAKIAHGYAISRRGATCCSEFFLPPIILGNGDGALTYVGAESSMLVGPLLPTSGIHGLMDRIHGKFLSVYIQLFQRIGDPPPTYEVVVGIANTTRPNSA